MNKDEIMDKIKEEAERIMLPAGKEFAAVLVNDIVMGALQELVDDTENPYDDMLLAAIKPIIQKKLDELLGNG